MNFDPRLYVEIVPLENGHPPKPHPILEGRFESAYAYKVLGVRNRTEAAKTMLAIFRGV